jgi:hypothetical protein
MAASAAPVPHRVDGKRGAAHNVGHHTGLDAGGDKHVESADIGAARCGGQFGDPHLSLIDRDQIGESPTHLAADAEVLLSRHGRAKLGRAAEWHSQLWGRPLFL